MNNMALNELYNKIIDLDLSEYTHQKLYDLCFKLDDEIERLNNKNKQWENKTKILETDRNKWELKCYEEVKKNDKAIEYINTMPLTKGTEWYRIQLLDILRGEDNE